MDPFRDDYSHTSVEKVLRANFSEAKLQYCLRNNLLFGKEIIRPNIDNVSLIEVLIEKDLAVATKTIFKFMQKHQEDWKNKFDMIMSTLPSVLDDFKNADNHRIFF